MYKDVHDIIGDQVGVDGLGPTEHGDNDLCFGVWLLSWAGWRARGMLHREGSQLRSTPLKSF